MFGPLPDSRLRPTSTRSLRYLVYAQDGAFVAQCLDLDVVSEGDAVDEAVANRREALELRFEGGLPPLIVSRGLRFGEISLDT